MKRIFTALVALLATIALQAKVIEITLADGTNRVITSSEIAQIDFNDDGTLTITAYNGEQLTGVSEGYSAVEVGTEALVTAEDDYTMSFTYSGTEYFSRAAHRISYVYPSTDPFGNPITLSGIIMIPQNIYDGEADAEGLLLFNHYTIFNAAEAPTQGYFYLEGMFMANPLNLNYIVVESDFYGFGATVRFPQAYLQNYENGRASLDGLLAAKDILAQMGIEYGPLLFNVGYSSGGFDALATQKCRDLEYADRVSFDKTFAGGSPSDLKECYRQYVLIDSTSYNAVPPLLMVSTNETQGLGIDYSDMFYPYIANKIDEWIFSKKYSSWPVCDSIGREKKIHEILMPAYCDLESEQSELVQTTLADLSIATGWKTDPTQRIYLMHSRGDDYVPVQSARGLVDYLRENGYEPNIIPGKTNLQTNFVVTDMGHLAATLVYLAQTVAALKAWPVMYTDGELNSTYQALLGGETSPAEILRQLEAMGMDVRPLVLQIIAEMQAQIGEDGDVTELDFEALLAALAEQGVDIEALNEMFADSGIDLQAWLIELYQYFSEYEPDGGDDNGDDENTEPELVAKVARALKALATTPAAVYETQLTDWFKANDIK